MMHPYLLDVLSSILIVSGLSWIAYQSGRRILYLFIPSIALSRLEELALGSGLGFGLLAYATLALGALGLWYARLFWGALVFLGSFYFFSGRTSKESARHWSLKQLDAWSVLWLVLASLFLIVYLLGDLTPEIFYDALYYHLAVPNLYRISHRLYNLPGYLCANFTLTIEMLYGLAITLGPPITAKLLHGVLAVLLVIAFAAFGERFLSPGAGALSGLLFISMPIVGVNAMSAGIDVGWAYFHVLAAYALVLALTQPSRGGLRLAGVFTGLSASCKYLGFPFILFAALIVVWYRSSQRRSTRDMVRAVADFFIPALLMLAPFLIRNVVFHANPFYPVGGTFWGTPRIDPQRWQVLISESKSGIHSLFDLLVRPWVRSMVISPYALYMGPLYVFAPLVIFFRTRNPRIWILKRYAVLLWALWTLTTPVTRFGFPLLTLLTPIMAEALMTASRSAKLRNVAVGVVLVGVLSNFYFVLRIFNLTEGWRVLAGQMTASDYLSDAHPSYPCPPYEGIDWMNKNLPSGSKILFAGEARSFYTRLPVVAAAFTDPQPLVEVARESMSGRDMAEKLAQAGITHVFLNSPEAIRTEVYGQFKWDADSWKVFQDFWSHHTQLVWKRESKDKDNPKGLYVFKLTTAPEPADPRSTVPNPFLRWAPR